MSTIGFPKPPSRLLEKHQQRTRIELKSKAAKRAVMERDQHRCRVCGKEAESVHELRFRSLGGKVSLENSIAVCGSGTTKCHGKLQRHRILVIGSNANGTLTFVER